MKILQLTLLLTFFTAQLVAQSVEELDRRNGFQDIKMATPVDNYEGLELKKDIEDEVFPEAQLYVAKKGFYENIGSLKIYDLEVKTYKGHIFQIRIVTEKDPNLYKGLKKIYGEPKYAYRAAETQWNATNVRLSYNSHSKKKMEMIYYSNIMTQQLKEEKKQEVKEIADDF
jgi:hypothetical protein